jgi:hypothetical protein
MDRLQEEIGDYLRTDFDYLILSGIKEELLACSLLKREEPQQINKNKKWDGNLLAATISSKLEI